MINFLVGMPGCGKSTIIKLYEEVYGKTVCDTDFLIEYRHGNINKIFEDFGEQYFRELETEIIKELCASEENALVATGGGAVLREENVRLFKSSGKVIYLRAELQTLLKRLEGDLSRPLLKGDTRARLTKLFEERTPLYESVADIIIDVDGLTPTEILDKILIGRE